MKARLGPPPILAFARMAFLDILAYRLRYLVGVLNYIIYMGVQYFLWSAVYQSAGAAGGRLGGYTFPEMTTYFAVGWILRVSSFNNLDRELAERVGRGDIALDLLRPVSLLAMRYGQVAGEAAFRVLFMGVPTALLFFPLFGLEAPRLGPDGAQAALSLFCMAASAVLAFHLFFLLNFLVGASTVFLEKIQGLLWAKFIVLQFLSGLLVPFDLFPEPARAVLGVLPFRGILYGPVSIYLGRRRGWEALGELGLQAAWVVALYLSARWLWAAARRKLLVQGG